MELDRIRYQIALGIGQHVELGPMLDDALAAFLAGLQCQCCIVCTPKFGPGGDWHMRVAHALPKTDNRLMGDTGAAWLPRGPDAASLDRFWRNPPTVSAADRLQAFIFPLPGFGALILDAAQSRLQPGYLPGLAPLAGRLAVACIQCSQFETAHRQAARFENTEGARQTDKSYLDQLFDNAQVGIIMADNDGTILRINPEFQRIFGYRFDAIAGKNIDAILATGADRMEAASITASVSRGRKRSFEAKRRCKDGSMKDVSVMASPIVLNGKQVAVYAFYQDVTARRQIESELIKAKKLEATGKLAGGIAHDFNNLLSVILGSIDLAMLDLPKNSPSERPLSHAKRICQRASDLTQKFITFSAGGQPVKRPTRLAALLRQVAGEVVAGDAVVCRFDLAADLKTVGVDVDQFRHVVSALLTNAVEAMPSGGKITITGANLSHDQCKGNPVLDHRRDYIRIAFADTGAGVPKQEIPRLFDPYYSTKPSGDRQGLGLGLTVAHSIMIQHGGIIQIQSEEKCGTTVCLYLPCDG